MAQERLAAWQAAHAEAPSSARAELARIPKAEAALPNVRVVPAGTVSSPESLTRRERQVLALLVQGCANSGIAVSLGISRATAKAHVEHILGKLGVSSRTCAAVEAVRLGLDGIPSTADQEAASPRLNT